MKAGHGRGRYSGKAKLARVNSLAGTRARYLARVADKPEATKDLAKYHFVTPGSMNPRKVTR